MDDDDDFDTMFLISTARWAETWSYAGYVLIVSVAFPAVSLMYLE